MSGNAQLPGKKTAAGSPEIYQRLFETAPDGILLLQHENGRIFDANPYLSTMLGYSKEELLGKHLWELETAGDTSLSRIMFEEAKGGKYSHCDEIILETKEGGAVHAELDSTVFEASEGKVVQCTVRTIPDNILHGKEDEKNLKKYERFIQNIQGIAYQSTMNWIPIFFQGSVKEITGYTKTELFSGDITWDKIMVPEDLAAIGDKIKDLGTIPGFSVDRDYRIKRKDGEIRWVHDSIQNVCDDTGKPAFLQGIIYDITDRKSTELALKSSEEKYRLLAESADDIIFTLDSEGNFVYINNYGADMLGLPADRIISRSYTDVMPPELLTKMESLIAELTGPDEPLQRECQCQDRIIDMKVIAVRIPDIKKQGYLFIGRDISSRKKAELALRETFSLLNAALESTEDGILVINLQGKITHYNKKFTTIWNIPDQVLETGQDSVALDYVMSDIVDPDAFIRKVRYLYQHPGEESFDTFAFKDGTVIERFSKPQYLDGTIVGRVWSFRNVSGIYQIKEVLEQVNKKLHLLSEVTRHDILNEVGIIIGYLDLLGDALPDDPALKKMFQQIHDATGRIQRKITFTRDYQQLGVKAPQWQAVRKIAEREWSMFRNSKISLVTETGNLEILADLLFSKVFGNLFDNAIRHGERVTTITVRWEKQEAGGVLSVGDDGAGIPHEIKERIFEKGFGDHTGFGLFLVCQILGITGMSIRECGEPGKGARFEITVPEGACRYDTENR